ncbi:MAG: iron-containing alcohol dehydrogenase [Anaerolineales bacterium]|nr:iron-containing alcohol dehydrogenase [Anaerolineales bacterium]
MEAPNLASQLGRRVLVITPNSTEQAEKLLTLLKTGSAEVAAAIAVGGEPQVEKVLEGAHLARECKCDLVIGFGGGSAIDTGKAIAALLTNPGDIYDYLEVIGRGSPLTKPSAPFIAIPTTAGTGSEVTRNAVLASRNHEVKISLRSPWMLPTAAVIDPELTYTVPPDVTANTGMDALSQIIEPFVSNQSNPMTDAVCREGIRLAASALQTVYADGKNKQAREKMCLVSLFGGIALANAKLGAVHGFAGPIGGMFPVPHGAICARLLPVVMETNLTALLSRQPEHPVIERFAEISQMLTTRPDASAEDGIHWLQRLEQEINIKPLSDYGVTDTAFPDIIKYAGNASSMKGNPIQLTEKELYSILEKAI